MHAGGGARLRLSRGRVRLGRLEGEIGTPAARHLAEKGAAVVLGARRNDLIDALSGEILEAGGRALAVATDVTKRDDLQRLVDAAIETYGRIDVDHISEKDVQEANQAYVGQIGVPAETLAPLVAFAINEPEDVGINEILFRPTAQEL